MERIIRFVQASRVEKSRKVHSLLAETDLYWKVYRPGKNHRTTYLIGLYGSGRDYISELMLHLGARAKYLRDGIRIRRVQTSIIYSGHATIKHVCVGQAMPTVTRRLVEAAQYGSVDLIFILRHPLDSLLTNWIWARQISDGKRRPDYISNVYKNSDDLCAYVEQNFANLKAFIDGDPAFFMSGRFGRFLSFAEYVEETELFVEAATLALRLEDFAIDPHRELHKIAELMSLNVDLTRLGVAPPNSKPFRYLSVKQMVPQFREFINGLDVKTKRRIEILGYDL